MKLKCSQCEQNDQVLKCNGCKNAFCNEHFGQHRDQLSEQIANIDKECQNFEENLNNNEFLQSCFDRIEIWENESIKRIRETAELARHDLNSVFNRMKNQTKTKLKEINSDIKSTRQSERFTEIHLNTWMEQLNRLRHTCQTTFTDDIIDENHSSLSLIKINKNQKFDIAASESYSIEKFIRASKTVSLSNTCRTATCLRRNWNGSNVSGCRLYSVGIHKIRLRIEQRGETNLFFGITSSAKESNPWNRKTPFAYGWWELPIDMNDHEETIKDPNIRTGDEITFTLDCINNQIQLEHHRTKRCVEQSISDENCPSPWKIAIVLYSPGDSVSILS